MTPISIVSHLCNEPVRGRFGHLGSDEDSVISTEA